MIYQQVVDTLCYVLIFLSSLHCLPKQMKMNILLQIIIQKIMLNY